MLLKVLEFVNFFDKNSANKINNHDFQFFRVSRTLKKQGGLAILVKMISWQG